MKKRANWYTDDKMKTWDRVKAAFANDWEQTKRDFGSTSARDLDQDVDDTIRQAAGSKDAFENREQALRFGYSAQSQYHSQYPEWNNELESHLRNDYEGEYDTDREYIRRAYEYHPA